MKTLPFLIMMCALFSCKTKKNAELTGAGDGSKIVATIGTDQDMNTMETAPYEIKKAKIEGNTLYLTIEYSGGCQEHDFKMIGSPSIAKSLPPIRAMKLWHNSNGDACRGLITKDLEVDIKEMAYIKDVGSVIYLTLDGWEERLTYTFIEEK